MLPIQIGLTDVTGTIAVDELAAAAAAFNIQVTRDLAQFWNVSATVEYLPDHTKIPAGVWPVMLVKSLPPDEGGFHLTKHNQPYAKVAVGAGWSIAASHEILEMSVDPGGNRLQVSTAIEIVSGKIRDTTGQFEYLVEVCDPCEAPDFGYEINGVAVSDFLTPSFYDATATASARYSFTGALTAPRQIKPGGYISWVDAAANEVQQLQYPDANHPPVIKDLGAWSDARSLRSFVDSKSRPTVLLSETPKTHALLKRSSAQRIMIAEFIAARRSLYR